MVTRSKRASNNAWDAKNMTVLGCKVRNDYADQARNAAKQAGTTINAVMKDALGRLIDSQNGQKQ